MAYVDDEDFELVNLWKWTAFLPPGQRVRYARRRTPDNGSCYLHRFLLGVTGRNVWVDFRDKNGLNCQRENMVVCAPAQATQSRRKRRTTPYTFKGVRLSRGRWYASCAGDRVPAASEVAAAVLYDELAREAYGQFACLNFPKPGERAAL